MKPTKQTFYLHKNGALEGYFFTEEQLNQLLSDVIKDALDTAAEKVKVSYEMNGLLLTTSITSTFDITYQKHKV